MRTKIFASVVAGFFIAMNSSAALAQATRSAPPPAPVSTPTFGPAGELPTIAPFPWMEAWSGFGFSNGYYGGWLGGVIALNESRNVWAEGVVLRIEGLAGRYHYRTGNLASGISGVPHQGGSLMIGYRKVFGSTTITGYVGGNIENHDNKDPLARVTGTEASVRVLGELYSRYTPTQDIFAQVSFSGAFQKWNVLVRPGFSFWQDVWMGPEGQVFGNKGAIGESAYKEMRLGGFVQWQFPGQTLSNIIVSGGYHKPLSGNTQHDGYYVQVGTSYRF